MVSFIVAPKASMLASQGGFVMLFHPKMVPAICHWGTLTVAECSSAQSLLEASSPSFLS